VSLANTPGEAEAAYRGLERVYRRLDDLARATECAHIVEGMLPEALVSRLRSLPDDSGARYALAEHHLLRGEYSQAERELAAAVSLDPGDPELEFGLVVARFKAGKASCTTVLGELDTLLAGDLKFSHDAAAALCLQARCLVAAERWPEAEEAAERSLRLDPSCAETHALLATIYLATDREDEARRVTEEAWRLSTGKAPPIASE
jgi:Flp pilus assembly protein TadD